MMSIFGRGGFIRFSSCVCVLIGICMGVALNMMVAPFLDELCDPIESKNTESLLNLRETNMVKDQAVQNIASNGDSKPNSDSIKKEPNDQEGDAYGGNDFYIHEPKIIREDMNNGKKFVRPRFASTELGIREKLFVGVLSTPNTVNSFGMALNKTFAHYVTKTQFFTNGKTGLPLPGMQIIGFPDQDAKMLPLHVLKYVKEHYQNTFDYYLFITDRTYIRGEKLFELVSHVSVSEEVHMGTSLSKDEPGLCSLEGGIILSQSVLSKVFKKVDTCLSSDAHDPSHVFENCVLLTAQKTCIDKGGDKIYKSFKVEDFEYDDDIATLRNDALFNSSFSIYPMPDDISLYKIHRYFCQLELNLTRQEIQKAKDSIISLSSFAPGGRNSLQWPIGVPEAYKPTSRFDVIHWTYFTDTHMYFDDDFTNIKPLEGVDRQDVQEIQNTAFEKLNLKYKDEFKSYKLINGYRKFEPSRGMEYTLDLELQGNNRQSSPQRKRVHLLRPLGKVEIVPMPYVTENSVVHLVLPLYDDDLADFSNFMDGFAKAVLDTSDNSYLYVVFVNNINSLKTMRDPFAKPKQIIDHHLNNHPTRKGTVTWKVLQTTSSDKSEISVIDFISRDLQSSDLVSLCTVAMEMNIDYLNRVRMNTIQNVQVFFPISFWQYKQSIVYKTKPYPPGVELGQTYGHFDTHSYEHSSFYMSDFIHARRHIQPSDVLKLQLVDLLLKSQKLHIFRGAEPSLRVRWHLLQCEGRNSSDGQAQCDARRSESLASRSQLAKHVFNYVEKNKISIESLIERAKQKDGD